MRTLLAILSLATLAIAFVPTAEADTCMWADPTLHAIECEWLWECGNHTSLKPVYVDAKCYAAGPKLPPPD